MAGERLTNGSRKFQPCSHDILPERVVPEETRLGVQTIMRPLLNTLAGWFVGLGTKVDELYEKWDNKMEDGREV